jgi:hypothetical protein
MANRKELRRQNLLPVCQTAALKLRQAGISISGTVQPVSRLMEWGIACDGHGRYQDVAHELELLGLVPDQPTSLEYLFVHVPGGLEGFVRGILSLDARTGARALLSHLDMRIKSGPQKSRYRKDLQKTLQTICFRMSRQAGLRTVSHVHSHHSECC